MIDESKRIKTKADLRRFLDTELRNYNYKRRRLLLPYSEKNILVKLTILLRKAEYHQNNGHKLRALWYRFFLAIHENKYGMHIPMNCCDEGLKLMHVGPILMNSNVCIGKNVAIHINTSFVAQGRTSGSPIIGDGVVIGVGAVVLGNITIADNVAIGANAVVNKSVMQENVAVAGVPAKIISTSGRLEWNKNTEPMK